MPPLCGKIYLSIHCHWKDKHPGTQIEHLSTSATHVFMKRRQLDSYILKAKKSADSAFQSKKSAEKVRKLQQEISRWKCVNQSKV